MGAASIKEKSARARIVLFSLLPTILLFGSVEIVLRLAGFEFYGIPRHFQFGPNVNHDLQRDVAEPDAELFWRLKVTEITSPHLVRRRHVHPELITQIGADRSTPGTLRVVAMGDSCTFFGSPPYPGRLEQLLAGRGTEAMVFSASVPGYTSHQGLHWFRKEIAGYHPAWVTVYYGWNDHWVARNSSDRELDRSTTVSSTVAARIVSKIRVMQAGTYLLSRLARQQPENRAVRVPQEHYRENLEELCREIRNAGANPLFITAPADLDAEDLRRLRNQGQIGPDQDLARLHEEYNDIVREVALSCSAEVVDFAGEAARIRGLVSEDGIHLTHLGIEWLATQLAERIEPADGGGGYDSRSQGALDTTRNPCVGFLPAHGPLP